MDCQTARQEFDAAVIENDESSAALRHAQSCKRCEQVLARRRQFDTRVAEAMVDVPLPAGLRDRLLSAVEQAAGMEQAAAEQESTVETTAVETTAVETAPIVTDPVVIRPKRGGFDNRRMVATLTAAVLLVGAFAVGSFWPAGTAKLPLSQWQQFALNIDALPNTDVVAEADELPLPSLNWTAGLLLRGPYRISQPETEAGLYLFQTARRNRRITGRLLVIPRAAVADVPTPTAFGTDQVVYQGGKTGVAWTQGEFVYVCWVDGPRDDLDRLYRVIEGGSFA